VHSGKLNHRPLLRFMNERHRIYLRRVAGEEPPWTNDEVLQQYKFTNVYRELDRVTIWIRKNIREAYANSKDLWFMLCIARQINYPETLSTLIQQGGWPDKDDWSWSRAAGLVRERMAHGEIGYGNAYLLVGGIQAIKPPPKDKPEFTFKHALNPLWEDREQLRKRMNSTMQEATLTLANRFAWGGFLSYEVACDLRWTKFLQNAPDACTWGYAGPGAIRGLNRLAGVPVNTTLRQLDALIWMNKLLQQISEQWPPNWRALEIREIEHSLCEYDKYVRVKQNEGKTKGKFDANEAYRRRPIRVPDDNNGAERQ